MYKVRDGQRILQFEGQLLGTSTSQRDGVHRWIEFALYRTEEDRKYILSRVGFSMIYHLPHCKIAEKSRLDESSRAEVESSDYPCETCRPHLSNFPFVSFEREKHWARVYKTPDGVIEGLMKEDSKSGSRYMTAVARRLLEDAGVVDDDIYEAVNVETVK